MSLAASQGNGLSKLSRGNTHSKVQGEQDAVQRSSNTANRHSFLNESIENMSALKHLKMS